MSIAARGDSRENQIVPEPEPFVPPAWEPVAGVPPVKIRDVRAICTAPDGFRLVVV